MEYFQHELLIDFANDIVSVQYMLPIGIHLLF